MKKKFTETLTYALLIIIIAGGVISFTTQGITPKTTLVKGVVKQQVGYTGQLYTGTINTLYYDDVNKDLIPPTTCSYRDDAGQEVYMQEPLGSGIADYVVRCVRKSDDTYAWVTI